MITKRPINMIVNDGGGSISPTASNMTVTKTSGSSTTNNSVEANIIVVSPVQVPLPLDMQTIYNFPSVITPTFSMDMQPIFHFTEELTKPVQVPLPLDMQPIYDFGNEISLGYLPLDMMPIYQFDNNNETVSTQSPQRNRWKPRTETVRVIKTKPTIDKPPVIIDPVVAYITNISTKNRKANVTTYSFEYLSFLIFENNINEPLPDFYNSIDTIIKEKLFTRDEDMANPPEDYSDFIDDDSIQIVFDKVWTMAKSMPATTVNSFKNLIGFYIYFNRRLRFLPLIVRGSTLNELISGISIESVIHKLMELGLYPVNNVKLFDRLWKSFVYGIAENKNRAEIKLSLAEYHYYNFNRISMEETYKGIAVPIDKLVLICDIDLRLWSNKKSFMTSNKALTAYKEITTIYEKDNIQKYLSDMLYDENDRYLDLGILSTSNRINVPNRDLWLTLESFNDVFKIDYAHVNKDNLESLFIEFANDSSFPLGKIDASEFTELWVYWVDFLNLRAIDIKESLTGAENIKNYNYDNIFTILTSLVNSKFLINYLENNNAFSDGYVDGTMFIDEAIVKVYEAMNALKRQMKKFVKHVVNTDERFRLTSAK